MSTDILRLGLRDTFLKRNKKKVGFFVRLNRCKYKQVDYVQAFRAFQIERARDES